MAHVTAQHVGGALRDRLQAALEIAQNTDPNGQWTHDLEQRLAAADDPAGHPDFDADVYFRIWLLGRKDLMATYEKESRPAALRGGVDATPRTDAIFANTPWTAHLPANADPDEFFRVGSLARIVPGATKYVLYWSDQIARFQTELQKIAARAPNFKDVNEARLFFKYFSWPRRSTRQKGPMPEAAIGAVPVEPAMARSLFTYALGLRSLGDDENVQVYDDDLTGDMMIDLATIRPPAWVPPPPPVPGTGMAAGAPPPPPPTPPPYAYPDVGVGIGATARTPVLPPLLAPLTPPSGPGPSEESSTPRPPRLPAPLPGSLPVGLQTRRLRRLALSPSRLFESPTGSWPAPSPTGVPPEPPLTEEQQARVFSYEGYLAQQREKAAPESVGQEAGRGGRQPSATTPARFTVYQGTRSRQPAEASSSEDEPGFLD